MQPKYIEISILQRWLDNNGLNGPFIIKKLIECNHLNGVICNEGISYIPEEEYSQITQKYEVFASGELMLLKPKHTLTLHEVCSRWGITRNALESKLKYINGIVTFLKRRYIPLSAIISFEEDNEEIG